MVAEGRKKRKKTQAAPSGAKRKARRGGAAAAKKSGVERQTRAGMPAKDSVVSETTFVSPKGTVYRLIETDEADEYEES